MNASERIAEWNEHYGYGDEDALVIQRLKNGGLTPAQIGLVLETLDEVCKYCWTSEHPCYCTRDD